MMFISFLNYGYRLVTFNTPELYEVLPIDILLLTLFIMTTYIMYPIEVISPHWLNVKKILLLYSPAIVVTAIYNTSLLLGAQYNTYTSSSLFLTNFISFDIFFRILLILLVFISVVLLFFIPHTNKYSNTNNKWLTRYIIAVSFTMLSFLLIMLDGSIGARIAHYFICLASSIYICYQELFMRLIHKPIDLSYLTNLSMDSACSEHINKLRSSKDKIIENNAILEDIFLANECTPDRLFERMDSYLNQSKEWRNPDLLPEDIADILGLKESSINKALEQYGFPCYDYYINGKRIQDFIKLVENRAAGSYQQLLFEVGFRCKKTAIKYFKEFTGQTPVEYFSFFR